jgi:hypothetical protein
LNDRSRIPGKNLAQPRKVYAVCDTAPIVSCCWRLHMKNLIPALALVCGNLAAAGCSVVMAAHQPSRKDVALFSEGIPRNLVLAEVGPPVTSEMKDGKRVEVFAFTQGYSKAARVSRTIGHGAADVFTLGLWEAVGTPTEAAFDGTRVAYEVTYDATDRIERVTLLKK